MPQTLTTKIALIVNALLQNTVGAANVPGLIDRNYQISLANGTGANQADRVYSASITLAASATQDIDLAGVLTDIFGAIVTFARIKAIAISALAANTNNVVLGAAAANAFVGPFGSATHTIAVKPGGLFIDVAPDATGWAVTAGTADQLRVGNSAGGSSVTFEIILIGASA